MNSLQPDILPDVLAYVDGDSGVCNIQHRAARSGSEVTAFIEHAVVRKMDLVVDVFDLTIEERCRGVVEPAIRSSMHEANDGHDAFG